MCGHVAPKKGVDEQGFAVDQVVKDIKWLGYSKVILMSDNEPSIVAVLRASLEVLRVSAEVAQVSEEHPKAYESQSNGSTEVAVRSLRGMYRTMKACLEDRLGSSVPPNHAISAWLIEHCAMLLNTRMAGKDGRSPWYRVRGRAFGLRLAGFAEQCMYKLGTEGPGADARGNVSANSKKGTYIGFDKTSCEHKFIADSRIVSSRHPVGLPEPERWSSDILEQITILPWKAIGGDEVVKFEVGEAVPAPNSLEADLKKVRGFYVLPQMLREFGYTQGCPQCNHTLAHGKGKEGISHVPQCRARVMKALE